VKTFLKILIAVAILNAAVRGGMAFAGYYQLKDAAQQIITFGANAASGQIQNELLQKAVELEVPLNPADVDVRKDGLHTYVTASYTQPVEVFPNFTYPVNFHFTVEALNMAGLGGANQGQPKQQ
jgi:hypothetical protein